MANPHLNNARIDYFLSDNIFKAIEKRMKEFEKNDKRLNAVFVYNITKEGMETKTWTLDLNNSSIYKGNPLNNKVDATFTVSDEDFVNLSLGNLAPEDALVMGKLKVTGSIVKAASLHNMLQSKM